MCIFFKEAGLPLKLSGSHRASAKGRDRPAPLPLASRKNALAFPWDHIDPQEPLRIPEPPFPFRPP